MIGYLKGVVIAIRKQELWLDVAGVGYRIRILRTEHLTPQTEHAFFIHTAVKEDAITLYGFTSLEELELFELLISVSGVGPKTAMGIIGNCSSELIQAAIQQADVNFFTKVPGIGKKGAQRIIIDLKNKIGSLKDIDLSVDDENDGVFLALQQFGFKTGDIQSVLKTLDRSLSEQQQIKDGLKLLGKTRV